MVRIRRWTIRRHGKRKVVWEEPALPEFVKINPLSPPGAADGGLQPGDMTMAVNAQEFLAAEDDETELPRWPWRPPCPAGFRRSCRASGQSQRVQRG
jgi:hypothetical protein